MPAVLGRSENTPIQHPFAGLLNYSPCSIKISSAKPTPYLSFDSMDYLDVLTAGGWIGMDKAGCRDSPTAAVYPRPFERPLTKARREAGTI